MYIHIDVISALLDDFWPGVFAMGLGGHVRPPKGSVGLIDWRLGGSLSKMIIDGRITGEVGEQSLLWSEKRSSKIYIFGMGRRLPLSAEQTTAVGARLSSALIKAREKHVLLVPDPILIGAGGKGAELPFLEGVVSSLKKAEQSADEVRLIIPGKGKQAEDIYEGFRKAILRIGNDAETLKLSMIESHFALQV